MKNYQEAIDRIKEHCLASPSRMMGEEFGFGHDYDMDHDGYEDEIELLQELLDEKTEQESRKDKLIIGSKWECVVDMMAIEKPKNNVRGWIDITRCEKVTIISLSYKDDNWFIEIGGFGYYVIMAKEQFLLCFKPIEKEE